MVSCRSTRSSFANEAVYAVCIYQFTTLTLMWHAYRQAQTDTDRDSNAGRRKLSVGQKASHHCVRRRLPKRKPAEEVSSFGIPLTLDRQAPQDGPKTVVWEGDLPGGGQRQMTKGSNSSEKHCCFSVCSVDNFRCRCFIKYKGVLKITC